MRRKAGKLFRTKQNKTNCEAVFKEMDTASFLLGYGILYNYVAKIKIVLVKANKMCYNQKYDGGVVVFDWKKIGRFPC